jgi:hypothetical protein
VLSYQRSAKQLCWVGCPATQCDTMRPNWQAGRVASSRWTKSISRSMFRPAPIHSDRIASDRKLLFIDTTRLCSIAVGSRPVALDRWTMVFNESIKSTPTHVRLKMAQPSIYVGDVDSFLRVVSLWHIIHKIYFTRVSLYSLRNVRLPGTLWSKGWCILEDHNNQYLPRIVIAYTRLAISTVWYSCMWLRAHARFCNPCSY